MPESDNQRESKSDAGCSSISIVPKLRVFFMHSVGLDGKYLPDDLDSPGLVAVDLSFKDKCRERCSCFFCETRDFVDGRRRLVVDEHCPYYAEAFLLDERKIE